MIDALKKLDKKFLYIAGAIILIPVLLLIFLAIIQGCSDRKTTYSRYEKQMITSATKYFKSTNKVPKDEGQIGTVKLSTLVNKGYIKSPQKALKDESCSGTISVRLNGSSIEQNHGGYLNYTVDLKCNNYSTTHLSDKIMNDLTTEGNGLYELENIYIYKGNKVRNYITFYNKKYRIMGIDSNGLIKLVKETPESNNRFWDNKYNLDVKFSSGKNIYEDSKILEYLIDDYNNTKKIKSNAKQHIVAHDSCIGKREATNYSISHTLDCATVLKTQMIGIPNSSDFAAASLDPDCNSLNTRACKNYNYLKEVLISSWTMNAVTENTYQALYIYDGIVKSQDTNNYYNYNIIIYIDGNELYQGGNGSINNPYILE